MVSPFPIPGRRVLGLGLMLLGAPAAARAADPEPAPPPRAAAAEVVNVIALRLPPADEPDDRVPGPVTIITAAEIARTGARTVYEALRLSAGIVLHDVIGNGVQQIVDLRGFSEGTATTVLVDGVRVNAPDDNRTALELIPIEAIERIEIRRGAAGSTHGGGALAGVVNAVTRRGGRGPTEAAAAIGTLDTWRLGLSGAGERGRFSWSGSLAHDETDGFRDNGAGEQDRVFARFGLRLRDTDELALALFTTDQQFGAPGALTRAELDADREQNPFNEPDEGLDDLAQGQIEGRFALPADWRLGTVLAFRSHDVGILTTGRTAAAFGVGFASDTSTDTLSVVAQGERGLDLGGNRSGRVTLGGEWSDSDLGADGTLTDPDGVPLAPASATSTARAAGGLFVAARADLTPTLSVAAGGRYDRAEIDFRDRLAGTGDDRRYGDATWNLGLNWTHAPGRTLFAGWSEGFLPPTSNDLFAFPGFGSNPDLRPTRSHDYELGYRSRTESVTWAATVFRVNVRDEVAFFIPDPNQPFSGTNRNIDQSHRAGLELEAEWRIAAAWTVGAALTLVDAEVDVGPNRGLRLPLVPEARGSLGLDWRPHARLAVGARLLGSSNQILTNDDANLRSRVPAYTLLDAALRWTPASIEALTLFAEVQNLFDSEHEVRGIFATDENSAPADFFTPGPPRRVRVGLSWRVGGAVRDGGGG